MGAPRTTVKAWALAATVLALTPAAAGAQLLPPLTPSPPPSQDPPSRPAPSEPTPTYSRNTVQSIAPVTASTPQAGSTTEGVNAQRTGYIDDPALVTPLEVRWSRLMRERVYSVVYGDGLGYAALENSVMAFDIRTGATVWTRPDRPRKLSFGNGVLVSPEEDGSIQAFAARTGATMWRARVGEDGSRIDGSVLVSGNVAYADASDTVAAFSLSTGALLWSTYAGDVEGRLATDGPRLYGSDPCGKAVALNASTGAEVWRRASDCFGAVGSGVIVNAGRIYGSDGHSILDATTGGVLGFIGGKALATTGNTGIFREGDRMHAVDLTTRRSLWRTQKAPITSSDVGGTPLVVGHSLFAIASDNRLISYSLETGAREQTIRVPVRARITDSNLDASPAAAPGTLLVPGGRRLTAYQSAYRPAPNGVDAGAPVADVEYGKRATIAGVIGTSLRGGSRKVTGQIASYGRKRFHNAGSFSTGVDGFFSATVARPRNFRTRILAGTARSKILRVYVYPRYRGKVRRVGRSNRIRASVRVTVPRGIGLRGRRVVLYNGEPSRKRYERLGSARLRGAGKGRGRATFRFNAIRKVGKRDFLIYCIPHASRVGLGRADVLDRRCGRARLPLR